MSKDSSKNKPSAKDYEKLGRTLESIFESGYINRAAMYKLSFVKGVVAGFGGVVGATIVVAVVLWALSLLHYVPFINKITDNVHTSLQRTEEPKQAL